MNVLITSAGRRTSLLRIFQDAVAPMGGQVIAADMDPLAPCLFIADHAEKVPHVSNGKYIAALLAIVEKYNIRLLVPTIDTELQILAQNQLRFEKVNCHVHISGESFISAMGDKWLTVRAFAGEGVAVPASWLPDTIQESIDLPERLFLKPRDGSASAHTYGINRNELGNTLSRVPNPIIQEEISGPEITIDAFIDKTGAPIHFVPRLRVKTLAGESIQGVTLECMNGFGKWIQNVLEVAGKLGARGAITLQAFDSPDGFLLSEINPRFGGGYPLGYAAGGHYPQWILREILEQPVPACLGDYKVGLYMTRSNSEIFVDTPKW